MRRTLLPAIVAFVLGVPATAQTPLDPVWLRTWPIGQGDAMDIRPGQEDNHLAVDPVSGSIYVSLDDENEVVSPHWDFVFTTASDGTDITPAPIPLLGSLPAGEFPNMEGTVDLAVWNGDIHQSSERSAGIGMGTTGGGYVLRSNASEWRIGFGTMTPQIATSQVLADNLGAVWVRSVNTQTAWLSGTLASGWLRWTRSYAPMAPFSEAVLMGSEVHACSGGSVRRVDRATGNPLGSYSLYTGNWFTQLATDGTDIFFAYSEAGFITLGARTTAGDAIWDFAIQSDYLPTELKADATGHAWLTANSPDGQGPGMLFVVNPSGSAQWFTYGASMNDLDLDDTQAYITGRSTVGSSETYLIAVAQDVVTGVHPASIADQVSIYPQPANDVLRIRTDRQVLSAQVLDANGRLVHEQARPNGILDVSALANGTYVLQLRTAEGLLRKAFVVAR